MAKKKKSKGKNPPSAKEVKGGGAGKEEDNALESKEKTDIDEVPSTSAEIIAGTVEKEEEKNEGGESTLIAALEEIAIQQEKDELERVVDEVTVDTEKLETPEDKHKDEAEPEQEPQHEQEHEQQQESDRNVEHESVFNSNSAATADSSTGDTAAGPVSKWGLLPDVDSSDDEQEEDEEVKEEFHTEIAKDILQEEVHKAQSAKQEKSSCVPETEEMNKEDMEEHTPEKQAEEKEISAAPRFSIISHGGGQDSDSDSDSDDDALISPYLQKKQTETSLSSFVTCADVSDNSVNSETTGSTTLPLPPENETKKKKRGDFPPKVSLNVDSYNPCDRGVSSGNMYLENIHKKKDSSIPSDPIQKEENIFRPEGSVTQRLASVKSDLEKRVIAARKLQEIEDRKLQERKKSAASKQWSYMKKEKNHLLQAEEELGTDHSDNHESSSSGESVDLSHENMQKEEKREGGDMQIPPRTWAPKALSLEDSDSDSEDSDADSDDGQLIVPRRYGDAPLPLTATTHDV